MCQHPDMLFDATQQGDLESTIHRAARELDDDGVAHIPGLFSVIESQVLRLAALEALLNSSPTRGYQEGGLVQRLPTGPKGFRSVSLLFWPALISRAFDALRHDDRMVRIVRAILGDDVKQVNNQLYLRVAGDGDQFGFHRDIIFRDPHPAINRRYLQTALLIDPMGPENGGIEFLIGSHRIEATLPPKEELRVYASAELPAELDRCRRWVATGRPGDMLVWSPLIVHASKPNSHEYLSRMYVMNGFSGAETTPHWPEYLVGGVPVPLDPAKIPDRRRR